MIVYLVKMFVCLVKYYLRNCQAYHVIKVENPDSVQFVVDNLEILTDNFRVSITLHVTNEEV